MRYTIMTPSGKSVTIEADRPPTAAEQDQIYKQVAQQKPKVQPKKQVGLGEMMGLLPKGSGQEIQKPNWVGEAITPRAASVQNKMRGGQDVSLDERVGAGGEAANLLSPLLGLPGIVAGGAIHGLTTPGADMGARTVNAGIEGGTQALLGGLLKILPKFLHPIESLGQARSSILSKSAPVATEDLQSGITKNLTSSPYYANAPAEARQAADTGLTNLLNNISPGQTVGQNETTALQQPATTGLNEVYKNLIPFEQTAKAYGRGGDLPSQATAQGANFVSHAVREYLKDASPWKANAITSVMRAGYGVGGNWKPILKALGFGGAGLYGTIEGAKILGGNR